MDSHHLTTVPMGYTNTIQIYQADMSFILQDEIPHYTYPFIDDLLVKSITSHYQCPDGSYKTIPENPNIHCFIWKHLLIVHHILQHLQNVDTTVSIKKFVLAALDATIIGHKCTFKGWILHEAKVQKIWDWPECENLTHVHSFLGVCGVLHIFIHNFATIAWSLINLTKKGIFFKWGETQQLAMQCLKDAIINSSALCCLDYESSLKIILAVDTSVITVRYILSQLGEDSRHYSNHFSSLSLTEVESCYSQAILKLYGLFHALHVLCIFIFGLTNFTIKIDAKYIKGMINNPDLQPNMSINQWITCILLFSFCLIHVPMTHHIGTNRLSHHLIKTCLRKTTSKIGWTMLILSCFIF